MWADKASVSEVPCTCRHRTIALQVPPKVYSKMSDLQRQYWDVKSRYMDCIIFILVGESIINAHLKHLSNVCNCTVVPSPHHQWQVTNTLGHGRLQVYESLLAGCFYEAYEDDARILSAQLSCCLASCDVQQCRPVKAACHLVRFHAFHLHLGLDMFSSVR